MIEVSNLCRSYGDFDAVQNLSFSAAAGDILGLVGPNGAGKTTTLKVLAGILPPSSGSVRIADHDSVSNGIETRQLTGYVPDNSSLFDNLTVWEHLDITASLYKINPFEAEAEELLEHFELSEKKHHLTSQLSLGMRQKLAICCACVIQPKVLIFDEPLTGLDPRGILSIEQTIRMRAEHGAAVIVSSHLLSLVESLCTHLLMINHGKKVLYGSMNEVLSTVDAETNSDSLEAVFFREIERRDQCG